MRNCAAVYNESVNCEDSEPNGNGVTRMRKGNGMAVLLITLGVVLILAKLGVFQFLLGLLIPILIIGLGVMAWLNGRKIIGSVIVLIGALMLIGKLAPLLVWIAAIALIAYGISMLRRKPDGGYKYKTYY